jgi:hypothetical protein
MCIQQMLLISKRKNMPLTGPLRWSGKVLLLIHWNGWLHIRSPCKSG